MRNRGFFWFLTILLTVICVYQLSFTYFSNSVEVKADVASAQKVDDVFAAIEKSGDSLLYLPNNTSVKISDPEARELAKAAFVNDTLKQLATTSVYPIFGSTFKDVKKRSLAFGLDLVGGMSVTLEISVPELLKSYARNPRSSEFKNVYDKALDVYRSQGGDFITIFAEQHNTLDPQGKLVRLFAISDIEELDMNSTSDAVVSFLKTKETGAMEGVEEIMNRRINQFGVAQPNIQKDPAKNRLYIELPGVQDEATVAEKLQSTANLQFFETYNYQALGPVIQEADRISRNEQSEDSQQELSVVDSTVVTSSDSTALASDSTESFDLSLDNSSEGGVKGLGDYLLPYGGPALGAVLPENRTAVDAIINRRDIQSVFPQDLKLMWSEDMEIINTETNESGYVLYMIRVPEDGKARVGGKDIEQASTERNQQEAKWTVSLKMTDEGADKWGRMTEDNKGLYVAITMDNVVYSAPRVNEAITSGNTEISGSFTLEDANNLTSLLNGGALPAPCVIKEQTKVGPTIGAENSRAGLISFGIAFLMVFIYMVFYYGKAGIVADIALFANILFIFGSLSSFGAVLTLAGIAGIVLTIGMAVDANVLIFERVREEQTAGKDLKSAIDTGFQKALSSIIDANVTTLLTAIVLKVFGSGPIESFATTLIIGIFTSVFAALVITRLVINWWLDKGKTINFESKMTKGAFKNFDIDFVGKRKMFYIISGVLIVGGLVALLTKGLNPSVEFSGGRTFGVKFEKPVADQTDYIGKELAKVFKEDGKEASSLLKTKSNSFFLEITTNYKLGDESANQLVKEKLIEGLNNAKKVTGEFTIEESRSVSPTVSKELISSSTIAIILSLIIIFTYILLRFGKWQYSTGAILAMLHDVTLVLAVFSIFNGILPFNMDIDQAFVAAILTVIGYSINDTVIVFDRIRENLGIYKGENENNNINKSLNSTLSRTINTSMTTFIVLLIIFLFGGAAIKGFIFALMIGVIVGTYSSVCIATPVLIDFSKTVRKVKS